MCEAHLAIVAEEAREEEDHPARAIAQAFTEEPRQEKPPSLMTRLA